MFVLSNVNQIAYELTSVLSNINSTQNKLTDTRSNINLQGRELTFTIADINSCLPKWLIPDPEMHFCLRELMFDILFINSHVFGLMFA